MQFYDANGVILPDASADVFLSALVITLFLDTKNNFFCGESSTMEDTGLLHGDPFLAYARSYLHLWNQNSPTDTLICAYYVLARAAPKYVTGSNIVELLQSTAKQIGFQQLGFFPHDIGSYSLRLGGSMTLYQDHISESTIKIIGRSRSDAFLIYLQGQVTKFTKVVSKAMEAVSWFMHQVPTSCPE